MFQFSTDLQINLEIRNLTSFILLLIIISFIVIYFSIDDLENHILIAVLYYCIYIIFYSHSMKI